MDLRDRSFETEFPRLTGSQDEDILYLKRAYTLLMHIVVELEYRRKTTAESRVQIGNATGILGEALRLFGELDQRRENAQNR